MNPSRLYVDLHVVQDLPPSNVNRDDNGTPKQATYGGAQRLRVSSQAAKRAARVMLRTAMGEENMGVRTKRLAALLTGRLAVAGIPEEVAAQVATSALAPLKINPGRKAEEMAYLLFFGQPQVDRLVAELMRLRGDWAGASQDVITKEVAAVDTIGILGTGHPLDVALFGRMVANVTSLNVDAAVQVAHAISTHRAGTEFDYFTAVDDEASRADEQGAGMIGTVEFNSATLYRYATLGVHQLVENLGGDLDATQDGVTRWIEAFSLSMPSGHQSSFAPHTRPAFVAAVLREDQPVNLVSAFESPVWAKDGFTIRSIEELARFAVVEAFRWGDTPRLSAACYRALEGEAGDVVSSAFGASLSMPDLIKAVGREVGGWLDERHG